MKLLHERWSPHSSQLEVGQKYFNGNIDTLFLQCGRKYGKALALNSLIPTPYGFKRNGDLVEGDTIFDEQGNQQKVLQVHPIIKKPESFRVWFDNGEFIDACADHQWYTFTKLNRKSMNRGGPQRGSVKNTKEIFETQMHGKEFNHSIPITKPIQIQERKDLKIPPYVLGAWLGDGSSSDGRIAGLDSEVFKEIEKSFEMSHSKTNSIIHYIKGLISLLREEGVLNNKHVPHKYLWASENQRRELLQGLLDTDGYCSKKGNLVEFCNTNKQLAESVYHLAASLGLTPSMSSKNPICTNGKNGPVEGSEAWLVKFHPMGQQLFKIKRKQDRVKELKKTPHHTIVKVERIESVPMRCITVSGPSSLYLAGKSFIPTHNTEMAIYFLWRTAILTPGAACYYVAPEKTHGRELIWNDPRLKTFGPRELIEGENGNEMILRFKNGSFIKIMGSENFQAANGLRPAILIYDEFCEFQRAFHETMQPNRMVYKCPLVIIGTPPRQDSKNSEQYFALAEETAASPTGLHIIKRSDENPMLDKEWLAAEKAALFKRGDEHLWYSQYEAKPVKGGKRVIFPMLNRNDHVFEHNQLLRLISRDASRLDWFCISDPGTTTVFGTLFGAINPYTKEIFLLDEIYETKQKGTSTGLIVPQMIAKAKELYRGGNFEDDWQKYYDEAAAWFVNEVQSQFDLSFFPTLKMHNKKENGISLIKDLLLMKVVKISDKCLNLLKEMESYVSDEDGKIPKHHDHLIDCFRYLLAAANYTIVDVHEAVRVADKINIRGFSGPTDFDIEPFEGDWTSWAE